MTRQEFINEVTYFGELIDFCNDNDCHCCDDVYDDDAKDEYFDEQISDWASDAESWQDLLGSLQNIPTGYDYYRRDDYDDWRGLDDGDFDDYKDDVLEWADDNDIFEDEDEEDPDDYYDEEYDDDTFIAPDEPMSIGELLGACSSQLTNINNASQVEASEEAEKFELFVAGCVTITKGE